MNLEIPDDTQMFQQIYHEMPAVCLLLDETLHIRSINHYGAEQLGYREQELIGQPVSKLCNETEKLFIQHNLRMLLDKNTRRSGRWECNRMRKDNSHFWARDTARVFNSDNAEQQYILLLSEDITETRYLITELEKSASTDGLTGLTNRYRFERYVAQAILSAQTDEQRHSLAFVDLNKFKVVNEVSGHLAGDELLRQITRLMQGEIRSHDILARLGGDEFGLLLRDCSIDEASEIMQKIIAAIDKFTFLWGNEIFNVGASIGLVEINSHSINAETSLKMADSACYTAKEKGHKNLQLYNPSDSEMLQRSCMQKFASRLNIAFERNQFVLYQQQIVALGRSDTMQRLEILVRIKDEDGNIIQPGSFIPAAEFYGLSTRLDLWVTENTLLHFQSQSLDTPVLCNINLSGQTLGSEQFIEQATEFIQRLRPDNLTLCFEITETAAISNISQAVKFIEHFNQLGCLFALDDFGSGFSSFAYLKTLPLEFLKIDGEFVRNIMHEPKDLALVQAINQFADVFGIQTIAEFVEDKEIMAVLTGLGIDFGQGYHLHKPQPLTDYE
jgi:diguanylate cyclase (GGDEF)-like protein/PAS domain S-box-containing protein